MSNIYPLLPRLTVNSRFIDEFISAEAPCCALGLVEERKQTVGFMALRPKMVIPEHYTRTGFSFGHSLLGNDNFVVIHFGFHFYNYATFNVLVNPNNPVVQTVLNKMIETGDYFFFAIDPAGRATAFRSELGQDDLSELKNNLPLIQNAKTTEIQYRKALAVFERNPDPPGKMLNWVCRDNMDYLDLTQHREELTPISQPVQPKSAPTPGEIIESELIPCDHCGEWAAQLIFIDDSADEQALEQYAHKRVDQYSKLNVPTWIIGEPLGMPGFDTKTRSLKVWPTHGPIQLKTANEFNAELDELLASHCHSENECERDQDQDAEDPQPQWHPISMLPTFTFIVDGMLEESIAQLNNMRKAEAKPYVLDDATLNRVFDLFGKQLDDQQYFMEQFSRWQQSPLSTAEAKEVDRLVKQSATLKETNEAILNIAGSMQHQTIDQIVGMDELELAMAVLTGKIKQPW
jgi:hypothetical protein